MALFKMKMIYVAAVSFGLIVGLGIFVFHFGEGLSYLSNNPEACANCHVMNHQLNSWSRSGHHHVATCNDCHLPASPILKYMAKARNGWNHSIAFTLENFHEPIQISPVNQKILQKNCKRCHESLVHDSIVVPNKEYSYKSESPLISLFELEKKQPKISCTHCHRQVGHLPEI